MSEKTPEEIVAERRAALFNIKMENAGFGNILKHDEKKNKMLNIEREKVATIMSDRFNIKGAYKKLKGFEK